MTSRHILLSFTLALLALSSCTSSTEGHIDTKATGKIIVDETLTNDESQVLDSMTLDNINPEEIITDDWSDDGDLELEVE